MSNAIKLALFFLFFVFQLHSEEQDPFRWLEEENSDRVQNWILNQEKKTTAYFENCAQKDELEKLLEDATAYSIYSLPEIRENGLFLMKMGKEDDKASILRIRDDEEQVLIVSPEEKGVVLTHFTVSRDGKKIAYGLSYGGTDCEKWSIFDVEEEKNLADVVEGIKFSVPVWSVDGNSLFYIQDGHQLVQHRIGTLQQEDLLLYQTRGMNEAMLQLVDLTEKGDFLIFSSYTPDDNNNAVLLWDFSRKRTLTCIPEGLGINQWVGELEGNLLFITDHNASYRKLISINPQDIRTWKTLIQDKNRVLDSATVAADQIIATFYEAAVAQLKIFDSKGKFLKDISLPGLGSVEVSSNPYFSQFIYSYTDFCTPATLYQMDLHEEEPLLFFEPAGFDSSDFVTLQVWVKGKDGTDIPLFLTHKKGLVLNEKTPVLLYGYGGFAISITPHFSPLAFVWMQQGGVYAVANLRGGYEFGKDWYEAGRLHNKKNVFQDFIDSAEWLSAHKIGSSQTIAIRGQSNGGLLTAACLTMRPEIFGAAIIDKGVLDMLRFHLFTIGYMWKSDYGDPETPEDYAYLLSYSPYHNIKEKIAYPATLVATSDHDDRVVPAHSYKFAAALQEAQIGDKPILLRVEKKEGHKRGASRKGALSSHLDMLLFLQKELHLIK